MFLHNQGFLGKKITGNLGYRMTEKQTILKVNKGDLQEELVASTTDIHLHSRARVPLSISGWEGIYVSCL